MLLFICHQSKISWIKHLQKAPRNIRKYDERARILGYEIKLTKTVHNFSSSNYDNVSQFAKFISLLESTISVMNHHEIRRRRIFVAENALKLWPLWFFPLYIERLYVSSNLQHVLNKYNLKGYIICSFGLVKHVSEWDKWQVQYKSWKLDHNAIPNNYQCQQ